MASAFDQIIRMINPIVLDFMNKFDIGKALFERLSRPYIAGNNLEQALEKIKEYRKQGRYSTFDLLGEASETMKVADEYVSAYLQMAQNLESTVPGAATISVKPTCICVVNKEHTQLLNDKSLKTTLERMVQNSRVPITLDMEDHHWTDISLEAAQYVWRSGYENFGIVLQSRLNRTRTDIESVLVNSAYPISTRAIRVRACIGIYIEPEDIATNDRAEAKKRLINDVEKMFDAGVYVEIATHDHRVIHRIVEMIEKKRIAPDSFEFQFLKGVQNAYNIEQELMDRGYKVRYYMPAEIKQGDGQPYMIRRLRANPDMLSSGTRNLIQLAGEKLLRA